MKIHEKWFKDNNLTYFVIQSDPLLLNSGKESRIDGNNFYCACQEAYEVLAHKLIIFYSYIFENTDFEFVLKFDDGCLIDQKSVLSIVNQQSLEYHYIGSLMKPTTNSCHWGKCKNTKLNRQKLDFKHNFDKLDNINDLDRQKLDNITTIEYAGGGYGYGLSRHALELIAKYKKHILSLELSYEDVLFGQIMYLENIKANKYVVGKYHMVK